MANVLPVLLLLLSLCGLCCPLTSTTVLTQHGGGYTCLLASTAIVGGWGGWEMGLWGVGGVLF